MQGVLEAARTGEVAAIERLLAAGVPINAQDDKGNSALSTAARNGTYAARDCVRLGTTACKPCLVHIPAATVTATTTFVAYAGQTRLVAALLNKRANPDVRLLNGCTPLMLAALGGHPAAAIELLTNGADAHAKDNNGQTAADWAERKNNLEVKQIILHYAR